MGVYGCKQRWPDMTLPFRFSLDTKGPLCLEVSIVAAKALNGSPRVGFIEAGAAHGNWVGPWPEDFSRGHAGPDVFAVAFDPSCGDLSATRAALQGQRIAEPLEGGREFFTARLKWNTLG